MKRRCLNTIIIILVLAMMASMTAVAYTNKDFEFSFVASGTQEGYTEPNQKTDEEELAYVTFTGGTVSSATPVFYAVFMTNWYDAAVTNYVLISDVTYRGTIEYWRGPVLNNWYQLFCQATGYTVSVEGRWCP